jgi:hypothetical protein
MGECEGICSEARRIAGQVKDSRAAWMDTQGVHSVYSRLWRMVVDPRLKVEMRPHNEKAQR